MIITFYINSSSPNTISKTLSSDTLVFSGTSKGIYDFTHPEILIDISQAPSNITDGSDWKTTFWKMNYASVDDGTGITRYYYISSRVMNTDYICTVTLTQDALMTYAGEIETYIPRMLIARKTDGDIDVYDDQRPMEYIQKTKVSSITTYEESTLDPFSHVSTTGILWAYTTDNTADSTALNGGTVLLLDDDLADLMGNDDGVIYLPYSSGIGGVNPNALSLATTACMGTSEIADATLGIILYPFDIRNESVSMSEAHPYGNTASTGPFYGIKRSCGSRLIASFVLSYASYTDYSGYGSHSSWMLDSADFELYLPFYGFYKLMPSTMNDGDLINVYALIDIVANTGIYIIADMTNKYYDIVEAKFGIEIPFTKTNATELQDQKISTTIKTAVGTIASIIQIGVGASTGQAWMVGSGISSGVSTLGNLATKVSTMHSDGASKTPGLTEGYLMSYTPYIRATYQVPVFNDSGGLMSVVAFERYNNYCGLPYRNYTSTIDSGVFFQVSDFGNMPQIGTKSENDEIRSLLRSGVYK